jgi:RibD C-terminal domain
MTEFVTPNARWRLLEGNAPIRRLGRGPAVPRARMVHLRGDPRRGSTPFRARHLREFCASLTDLLRAATGGQIIVDGSAQLVHALLDNDLVDELRLMVFPVTFGRGLRVSPRRSK